MWPDEGARSPWIFWGMRKQIETMLLRPKCMVLLFSLAFLPLLVFSLISQAPYHLKTGQHRCGYLSDISDHIFLNTCLLFPLRILFLLMTISHKAMESKEHWHSFPPACLEAQKISFIFEWNDHLNSLALGFRVLSLITCFFFEDWGVVTLMEYFSGKHEDP